MKQDIFTQVGKRTPYRTPEGFFEQQEQMLKNTFSEVRPVPVVRPLHRKWWYAAVASVILIGGIYGITRLFVPTSAPLIMDPASESAPIYSQTSSSSDDWSDFAEADVFLDNMNW